MKKVLFVSNVLSHIYVFHLPYIKWFKVHGFEVHVMANSNRQQADCPHSTVCGATHVGNEVWLGAASTLIQCLTVCDNVMLGAGSVTVRNIEEAGTYAGVPSKRLHENKK